MTGGETVALGVAGLTAFVVALATLIKWYVLHPLKP